MTVLWWDHLTWYCTKHEFDHVMCNATMCLVSLSRRRAKWISASRGEDSPPCNINQNGNKVKVVSSENSLTNQVAFYHGHLLVPFSTVAKSEVGLSSKMPVSPTVIVKKNHPLGCHNLQIHLNAMQTVNINLHDRENKCWRAVRTFRYCLFTRIGVITRAEMLKICQFTKESWQV